VVTGLLVALLLLSTAIYVVNVQKSVPKVDSITDSMFSGYRETAQNTMVSALANASAGGSLNVLGVDLAELKAVVSAYSYEAIVTLDYTTRNSLPYAGGLWISKGASGEGISAAYADFVFHSSSPSGSSSIAYTLNVTSQVHLSGGYVQLNDSKQVNLAVNVLNDGVPALAQSFVFHYQNDTDWVLVPSPVIVDNGDGSYVASFAAQTLQVNEPLYVSTLCLDQRGISIGANLTCNHI
jgi:hypothetical protein